MHKLVFLVTVITLIIGSATVLAQSYTAPSLDPAVVSAGEAPLVTNAI